LFSSRGGEMRTFPLDRGSIMASVLKDRVAMLWRRPPCARRTAVWSLADEPLGWNMDTGSLAYETADGDGVVVAHYQPLSTDDPLRAVMLSVADPVGTGGILLDGHGGELDDPFVNDFVRAVAAHMARIPHKLLLNSGVRSSMREYLEHAAGTPKP